MTADSATLHSGAQGCASGAGGDQDATAAAEAALAEIQQNFGAWVGEDLDQAKAALERTRAAAPESRMKVARDIYTGAHNIKGHAATFGYQLVTDIADSVCRLVKSVDSVTPEVLALTETHLDHLANIIANELTGDGGEDGRALLAELIRAVDEMAGAA